MCELGVGGVVVEEKSSFLFSVHPSLGTLQVQNQKKELPMPGDTMLTIFCVMHPVVFIKAGAGRPLL